MFDDALNLETTYIGLYGIGKTELIVASVVPGQVPPQYQAGTITYSSSNTDVATVSGSGLVTATGYGKTKITVKLELIDVAYGAGSEYVYKYCDVLVSPCDHNYEEIDEDGFYECGAYSPAELVDGFYEIRNAGNLFWLAKYINETDKTVSSKLMNDIDLENRLWTPIGTTGESNNNFCGVFDGQGYTIEGLYVEGNSAGLGFFGEVRTGTVKNFTIFGEVVVNQECDYIGGVIGSANGLNSGEIPDNNGATIQNITSYVNLTAKAHGVGKIGGFVGYANHETMIENCSWHGTFDAGIYRVDNGAGGFIGRVQENTGEVTIRNCAAYGTIRTNYAGDYNNTATIYMGGFLSYSNTNAQTTLENCLFAGKFEKGENLTAQAELAAFGTLVSVKSIKNCYYFGYDNLAAVHSGSTLNPDGKTIQITSVTEEQLASGEIAYKLQGTQETLVWGQT